MGYETRISKAFEGALKQCHLVKTLSRQPLAEQGI